jgi:CBS domain-containing protein
LTQVNELMTRGVRTAAPTDTLCDAAQAMEELDVGVLLVCDGERLVGVITDRDIAVRGVAQRLSPDRTHLDVIMTGEVRWCFDDSTVEEALRTMSELQIRRLPVIDRDRRLVGVLSLGDAAAKGQASQAGEPLARISQPAEPDRSSQSAASGAAGGGQSKRVRPGRASGAKPSH